MARIHVVMSDELVDRMDEHVGSRERSTFVARAVLERGARPDGLRAYRSFLDRLRFLITTREAAQHAGRYQRTFRRRGITIHTPDALIAGTARAHGAILVTDDVADFPMRDVRAL